MYIYYIIPLRGRSFSITSNPFLFVYAVFFSLNTKVPFLTTSPQILYEKPSPLTSVREDNGPLPDSPVVILVSSRVSRLSSTPTLPNRPTVGYPVSSFWFFYITLLLDSSICLYLFLNHVDSR